MIPANAQAVFTLKKRVRDPEPLMEKTSAVTDNVAAVFLAPSDTDALPFGTYYWDVRVIVPGHGGADVYTPMEYASFQLLEVIGDGV